MRPTPTPKIAYAAGLDAGNRSMRASGRSEWNEDDWNAASDVSAKLLACTCPECGGSTRSALEDPSRKPYQPGCATCGGLSLNLPDDRFLQAKLKDGPNCGVTAVAVAAGVSLDEAFVVIRKIKGKTHRWKGGTNHNDRVKALRRFKVPHRAYVLRDKRRLYAWVRDRAEPGKLYMLRVTGHVLLLKDGWCMDQGGPCRIEVYARRNALLSHVVEIHS